MLEQMARKRQEVWESISTQYYSNTVHYCKDQLVIISIYDI
jgi:hypothetical protein